MPSLHELPDDVLRLVLLFVHDYRLICYLAPLHSSICEMCGEDDLWLQQSKLHLGAAAVEAQSRRMLTDESWQGWLKFFAMDVRRRAAQKVVLLINKSRQGSTGHGVAQVAGNISDVIELDFGATCLGTQGAQFLSQVLMHGSCSGGRLEQLKLPQQLVREAGLRSLAPAVHRLPVLHVLNLEGNRLGVGGARAMAEILSQRTCKLRSVNLSDNCLGEEGAAAVASALNDARTLQWLKMDLNGIGDTGASTVASACRKSRGSAVRFLSLRDNAIGSVGVRSLCELLSDPPDGFRLLDLSTTFATQAVRKERSEDMNRTTEDLCKQLAKSRRPPPPPPPVPAGARKPAPQPEIECLTTVVPKKACVCM
eukprot:TRINITY_DN3978_c0_g1_i1.p1 TRINITY_DN3978_c0_g1~~TRINITY_DN3978_c0_g1_i1.p1  ORF type:complete len:385 (+),score=106.42 TRINITY_DN3978_c0_g1_i1:57-1157(+)